MGPTSGGSIGSQGMGDPVYLLALCTAVPAVHSDMPAWYGALSVSHHTSQDVTDRETLGNLLQEDT